MLSNQDMVRLLASATSESDDSYKSMQELIKILASCVGIDEETGEAYIKIKDAEDTNLSLPNTPLSNTLGFGSPSVSTLDTPNEEES
jgi:hypothetical protein